MAVLRIQWVDPKLAFSPDDCQCKTQVFPDDDFGDFAAANELLWPTFTLFNQQGNRWTQNKRVVVQPNGQATYFERFSTTFQAPDFDFRRFPFDRQSFFIAVQSLQPAESLTYVSSDSFNEVGTQLGEEE